MNTLTVIASESYDNFSKQLQKEVLESLSDRPVTLTPEALIDRVLINEKGQQFTFDNTSAMNLIFKFKEKSYVDADYKITDELIKAIEEDKVELPTELIPFKASVYELMQKIHTTANFKASADGKADNIDISDFKPNANFAKKSFKTYGIKSKLKPFMKLIFRMKS